jgi:hypothetical protein
MSSPPSAAERCLDLLPALQLDQYAERMRQGVLDSNANRSPLAMQSNLAVMEEGQGRLFSEVAAASTTAKRRGGSVTRLI